MDPDNRRPVDFARRNRLLEKVDALVGKKPESAGRILLRAWAGGGAKLNLTSAGARVRRRHPELFLKGDYTPLAVRGPRRRHLIAFARSRGPEWAVVIAPRFWTQVAREGQAPLGAAVWPEETIQLPPGAPSSWKSAIGGEAVTVQDTAATPAEAEGAVIPVADILARFPVGLLIAEPEA